VICSFHFVVVVVVANDQTDDIDDNYEEDDEEGCSMATAESVLIRCGFVFILLIEFSIELLINVVSFGESSLSSLSVNS
jgi:hypothetical protein